MLYELCAASAHAYNELCSVVDDELQWSQETKLNSNEAVEYWETRIPTMSFLVSDSNLFK